MASEFAPVEESTYKLWDIDSIFELDPPEWLIEDILPQRGSTLLYGPTNVGKSLVTLDWAFRLASGWSWMGKAIKQSSVLYVYAEGGHDLQLRYQAWVEGYDHQQPVALLDNLHFIGLDEEIKLRWNPDAEEPPEGVRKLYATVDPNRPNARKYDVIIFDPAQEVWRGMDGNSDQHVAMAWRIVKDIQREHDAASVIVHHARKDGDTFRGATTWLDLADTGFLVTEDDYGLVTVANTKNRYSEKGHGFLLRRNPHVIDRVPKLLGQTSVYLGRGYRKSDAGSPEERAILAVLADSDMTMTQVWNAVKDNTDLSHTMTRNILRELEERGVIDREGPKKPYRLVASSALEPGEVA